MIWNIKFFYSKFFSLVPIFSLPGIFIFAEEVKINSLEFLSLLGSINSLEKFAKKQL